MVEGYVMEAIRDIKTSIDKIHTKVDTLTIDVAEIKTEIKITLPNHETRLKSLEECYKTEEGKKFYQSPKFQTGAIASGGAGIIYGVIELIKFLL